MLESLLKDNMDELVEAVTGATQAGADDADGLVRKVIGVLQKEVASGRVDLGALMKGDFDSLKGALNFSELGESVHGGADTAEQGVTAMLGPMRTALGGLGDGLGGIDGLLKQVLGGGDDKDGGGGIFGIVGDVLGGGGGGDKK